MRILIIDDHQLFIDDMRHIFYSLDNDIDLKSYKHEFISSCSFVSDNSRLIDTNYSAKRLFELRSYK